MQYTGLQSSVFFVHAFPFFSPPRFAGRIYRSSCARISTRVRYPFRFTLRRRRQLKIMNEALTIERIIAFLKVDLTFACCWPLSTDATIYQRIWDKVFRCLCCLNGIIMIIVLWYTMFIDHSNMLLVMKVGCELSACMQVPIQIMLYTFEYDRLQVRDHALLFQRFQISLRLFVKRYLNMTYVASQIMI